uniref:Sugar phosphate transporter domain-containing protein n=1 Tax=Haptolina brevifila TaxID=156173 RepID=A0A7S2IC69_9EUKA
MLATREPQSTYAILTVMSCLLLTPVALTMEGLGAGRSKLAAASLTPAYTGWRLPALLVATGLLQYLSNEIAFQTLSMVHPITYALANTFKRSIVVAASLLFFGMTLPPLGAAGAAMAVLGALGYSLAIQQPQPEPRAPRPKPEPAPIDELQERVEPIGRRYLLTELTRAERRARRKALREMERAQREQERDERERVGA